MDRGGRKRTNAVALIVLLLLSTTTSLCLGFQPPRLVSIGEKRSRLQHWLLPLVTRQCRGLVFAAQRDVSLRLTTDEKQEESGDNDDDTVVEQVILRGSEQDEVSEEFWQELEEGQPSEWSVMKEVGWCVYETF